MVKLVRSSARSGIGDLVTPIVPDGSYSPSDLQLGSPAWLMIGLALTLNALDGYDILAISFAAPGIARDWHVQPATLGFVLSMELLGMAVGSIMLGRAADRFGRRPVVLGCLALMAVGMCGAAGAAGLLSLCGSRLFTGLGIGGMLASLNAMVSEAAPRRSKAFAVALMSSGYSIGGLTGGAIASKLLLDYGWRSAFLVGAAATIALFPIIWRFLPESSTYLVLKRQPPNVGPSRSDPPVGNADKGGSGRHASAQPGRAQAPVLWVTLVLTAAYLSHAFSFYFVLKWMPNIVVNLGHTASEAGRLLVSANAGGLVGALGFGLLSLKFPVRYILLVSLPATSTLIAILGVSHSWFMLTVIASMVGCMANASVTGMYALCAESFPTPFRAAGTGFVIGFGRGGAVIGPVAAGLLIGVGLPFNRVALTMALGSLIGAVALLLLPYAIRRPQT